MKTKPKVNNLVHIHRDRGYRFTDDGRDPVLDQVTRAITESGLYLKVLESRCGVTRGCMHNWMSGKTKRPQNATVEMVLRALGYRRVILDPDGKELKEPTRRGKR